MCACGLYRLFATFNAQPCSHVLLSHLGHPRMLRLVLLTRFPIRTSNSYLQFMTQCPTPNHLLFPLIVGETLEPQSNRHHLRFLILYTLTRPLFRPSPPCWFDFSADCGLSITFSVFRRPFSRFPPSPLFSALFLLHHHIKSTLQRRPPPLSFQ